MGEMRNRSVSVPGEDERYPGRSPRGASPARGRAFPAWVAVFLTAALFFGGAVASPRAGAQDEPPKAEPPRSAPTAPAESPQRSQVPPAPPLEPAPAEQQKGAPTAPDEQQKGAPTAPGEQQKGAPTAPDDTPKTAPADTPKAAPTPVVTDADFDEALALSTAL